MGMLFISALSLCFAPLNETRPCSSIMQSPTGFCHLKLLIYSTFVRSTICPNWIMIIFDNLPHYSTFWTKFVPVHLGNILYILSPLECLPILFSWNPLCFKLKCDNLWQTQLLQMFTDGMLKLSKPTDYLLPIMRQRFQFTFMYKPTHSPRDSPNTPEQCSMFTWDNHCLAFCSDVYDLHGPHLPFLAYNIQVRAWYWHTCRHLWVIVW